MTATIEQAAAALSAAVSTIDGLRSTDHLPDTINPPHAVVTINQITYHRAMQMGNPPIDFTVTVFVGRISERVAQSRMYAYMSATGDDSVRAAIESDLTLGGVVQSAHVVSSQNIATVEIGGAIYLAVDFTIVVHP